MYFQNIIVIGNGSLLTNCLRHICTYPNLVVKCIESEKSDFSNLETFCRLNNIDYLSFPKKRKISNYFLNVSARTLVLSIHNNYIFSKEVLKNLHLKIINFHNSLLPKHPGRNAPTWAIYDEDEVSGITWHEVSYEVDRGDIIFQNDVPLTSELTGMQLTRMCVQIGLNTFKEIFTSLLKNEYKKIPQPINNLKMHYSYEIPNDGVLDINWPVSKVSAFLRSIDYGAFPVFPKAKLFHKQAWYQIESHFLSELITNSQTNIEKDNEIYLNDEKTFIKLILIPLK